MRVTYSISGKELSIEQMESISLIRGGIVDICNAVRRRLRGSGGPSAA